MDLTPLGRPQARGIAATPFLPAARPSSLKPAAAMQASCTASESCDIHRLLESYSNQITQTEGQIYCIHQSQQQVVQEHQADLDSLADAKSEAQKADEDSAMLAAEVVQMQMEVAAKQADCAKIKTDLTALAETCRVTSEANNADKRIFVVQCQQLDEKLRAIINSRESSGHHSDHLDNSDSV